MIKENICTFEQWIEVLGELTPEELEKAQAMYDRLKNTLQRYTPDDHGNMTLQHNIYPFQKGGGYQMISHPNGVLDESLRSDPNDWNWHGQNNSRNLFTCGVVFDTERRDFSMHT